VPGWPADSRRCRVADSPPAIVLRGVAKQGKDGVLDGDGQWAPGRCPAGLLSAGRQDADSRGPPPLRCPRIADVAVPPFAALPRSSVTRPMLNSSARPPTCVPCRIRRTDPNRVNDPGLRPRTYS